VWCGRVQCLGARPTLKYNPMGQPFGLHSGPGEGISGRRSRGTEGGAEGGEGHGGFGERRLHRRLGFGRIRGKAPQEFE